MFSIKNTPSLWKSGGSTTLYLPNYAMNIPTFSQPFLPNPLKIRRKGWRRETERTSSSCSSFSTQSIRQIETPNGFFIVQTSLPFPNPFIVQSSKDIWRDVNSDCASCTNSLNRVRNKHMYNNATNKQQYYPNSYSEYKKKKFLRCAPPTDPKTIVRFQSNHSSSQHTFQLSHECTLDHGCYKATYKKITTIEPCQAPFQCKREEARIIDIALSIYATPTSVELRWVLTDSYNVDIVQNGVKIASNISATTYFIPQVTPQTEYTYTIYLSGTATVLTTRAITTPSKFVINYDIPFQDTFSTQSLQPCAVNYNAGTTANVNLQSTTPKVDVYKDGQLYSSYIPSASFDIKLEKVAVSMNYVGDYIYCTDGNKAAYSTDFGATWTEIKLKLPAEVPTLVNTPFSLKSDNKGEIIYLLSTSNNYSLLFSSDGGKSYIAIFTGLVTSGGTYAYPTIIALPDFSVILMYASTAKTFLSSQIFVVSDISPTNLYSVVNVNDPSSLIEINSVNVDLTNGDIYLNEATTPNEDFSLVACAYKDREVSWVNGGVR